MNRRLLLGLLLGVALAGTGCGGTGRPPHLDPTRVAREIAADPGNAYWRYRQAELDLAAEDPAAAEAELRAALASEPGHGPSLSLLSRLLYESGRNEEAIRILETARNTGDFPPELEVALALHYDAVDRIDDARAATRRAERAADWSEVGSALTFLRLRGDGYVQAEATARRALEADPESAPNHNNFGITQLYAGKPDAARGAFLEAVRLDPELPGPYYNLAIVEHFYFLDTERARDWFRRYRELASEDPDGLAEALRDEPGGNDTDPEEEGTR